MKSSCSAGSVVHKKAAGWCGVWSAGSREEGCESGGFHFLEYINLWSSPLQFPGFFEKNRRHFHLKCHLCVHASV